MNIIEYERGDGSVDYAPESYLNQGASVLIHNVARDEEMMSRLTNPSPSPGFDFDDYRERCKEFDPVAYRNQIVLNPYI